MCTRACGCDDDYNNDNHYVGIKDHHDDVCICKQYSCLQRYGRSLVSMRWIRYSQLLL